jgi:hypothetical protein
LGAQQRPHAKQQDQQGAADLERAPELCAKALGPRQQ